VGLHLRGGGIQSGPHAQAAGGVRLISGRGVKSRAAGGVRAPQRPEQLSPGS
jgi:hypothetical protein